MRPSTRESQLVLLPSVDSVLKEAGVAELAVQYERRYVVDLVRSALGQFRHEVESGADAPSIAEVARKVVASAESEWSSRPAKVINATGVVLHTNLGRAPLSRPAIDAICRVSAYSTLEYDLDAGERGSRQDHVRGLIRLLLGADATHLTVNAASAVLLALTALARNREVLVSRGQAVEIGGGFRVPEILRQSGARLVEVGTTNRTSLSDYAEAISPRTAAILHVHASNFRITGFTEQPTLPQLARLTREQGVLLIVDNGSGSLLNTERFGLTHEPTPREAVEAGVDVVAFSGDKLLGGPQVGVLAGRTAPLHDIARHPLARALRPDKTIIAALVATLQSYVRGDAEETVPIWKMIAQSQEAVRERAEEWAERAARRGLHVTVRDGESTIGGGSLPTETLATALIALPRAISARALRSASPPVVARTQEGRVVLDLRTVQEGEEDDVLAACVRALTAVEGVKSTVTQSDTP